MGIFYIKEHTSCHNYATATVEGFSIVKLDANQSYKQETTKNYIVFLLEGNLKGVYGGDEFSISVGECFFVPPGKLVRFSSKEQTMFVLAQFEKTVQGCNKLVLSDLLPFIDEEENLNDKIYPLKIKKELSLFINSLICYLGDGANCVHFHELKLKEMFWLFRFYYTKEELAKFLYPIIGTDYDFKTKVLSCYRKVKTVKDLAEACNMSISTFNRKFIEEFKESPNEWIHKQINMEIKYRLTDTTVPISDIAYELKFSSVQQFSRYCKRVFGQTPSELRNSISDRL